MVGRAEGQGHEDDGEEAQGRVLLDRLDSRGAGGDGQGAEVADGADLADYSREGHVRLVSPDPSGGGAGDDVVCRELMRRAETAS